MEIKRTNEIKILNIRLRDNPVVAILGARQCGKTTLARQFSLQWPEDVIFFDLENPLDIRRLEEPLLALENVEGLIILDEIQRVPDLFSVLRVLADRPDHKAKFLILGSASRDLIRQSSESLAGRISYLEMGGFSLDLVGADNAEKLWIRGAFPRSYLASSEGTSYQWRQDFIATFLERDIPQLGFNIPAKSLGRFWQMLAHYHGQIFNASEIAKSLGVSDHTVQRYLDLLSGTFMVRQLRPWHYNTKKRIIKRPKIYFRDTGILHALFALENKKNVLTHPKLGASWEGFALEETVKAIGLKENETFFWGVHAAAEVDLVFQRNGQLYGVEVKYAQAPGLTSSMRMACDEMALKHLWVIYPGNKTYALDRHVSVLPLNQLDLLSFEKNNP